MIGATTGIEKAVNCAAAIATQYLLATFHTDDDTLKQATGDTDLPAGVFQHTTSAAAEIVRTMLSGITQVKLGGTVTRGQPLTSDAAGKAVAAAPGSGVNAYVWGQAMASGVDGDIIPMLIAPGRIQG